MAFLITKLIEWHDVFERYVIKCVQEYDASRGATSEASLSIVALIDQYRRVKDAYTNLIA